MTLNFSLQTMKDSRATSLRCLKKKQKQNKNVQLKFYCEQIFKKQWRNLQHLLCDSSTIYSGDARVSSRGGSAACEKDRRQSNDQKPLCRETVYDGIVKHKKLLSLVLKIKGK